MPHESDFSPIISGCWWCDSESILCNTTESHCWIRWVGLLVYIYCLYFDIHVQLYCSGYELQINPFLVSQRSPTELTFYSIRCLRRLLEGLLAGIPLDIFHHNSSDHEYETFKVSQYFGTCMGSLVFYAMFH
jgi:hypothetical protein